jgi:predicted amidophosphoribosyltransferase
MISAFTTTAPQASTQTGQTALKCPVCSAGFRNVGTCPRCGTDLTMLMQLAARAWALRQLSRASLMDGDLPAALRYSAAAARIKHG